MRINSVFALAEDIVNGVNAFVAALFALPPESAFTLFSPEYFYMDAVPVRILFPEVLFVFLFGVLSAAAASWLASRSIARMKPAEFYAMNNPVLELKSVCKTFFSEGEELKIIDNLDLIIESSSRTVIVGESGCGKSTLLNIIGGLETPSSGSVTAGPYSVHSLGETELAEYRARISALYSSFTIS